MSKKIKNKLKYILLILGFSFFGSNFCIAQCTNCNANFPAGTFTSTNNTLTNVNTCIFGGEYANYSVTNGQTYTWTTCGFTAFDTQLTLFSGGCAGTFIAYNDDFCGVQSTITWTATFTGTVTLLLSNYNCANNSTCMTVQWACVSCGALPPATYTHPTVGIASEFVGSCLVSNCGPFTYADNGNSSGNYSNNITQIYRTFCPSIAGNCMSVTFNSFATEATVDFLTVGNGPTQNSALFTTAPANALGRISGSPAVPFSYTSSHPSGCLTFRFNSNASVTAAGWNATMQCVPCAGGPNGTDNNDCSNMTAICSNAPISTLSTGPGISAEGCSGSVCPAGGENHSNWYTFTAQTTGTLAVTVTPVTPADDYDFAIYGPGATCGSLGSPIRCSDAGTTGTTGASGTGGAPANNDLTEDVNGNGILQILNVVAGQSYIMVVDKWSPAGATGYTLSFGGTASLDCTVLPIELSQFDAIYQPDLDLVDLTWITASEQNSDYYNVEKSTDGINFTVINRVNAAGTTQLETQYFTVDENPARGVNYYRLNMFDKDGASKYSEVRAVNILEDAYDMLTVFPNPTSGITEVIFNSYAKEDVLLTVQSSNGAVVVNTTVPAKNGGNKLDLDMAGQAAGVYIVTVTTSRKTYKSKLVKN